METFSFSPQFSPKISEMGLNKLLNFVLYKRSLTYISYTYIFQQMSHYNVWVKKKPRQIAVVYHYSDLSRFFWLRRYMEVSIDGERTRCRLFFISETKADID